MSNHEQPTKAVALKYDKGSAPTVSAIAEDALAQEMIALAEEAGVYIHQDEHLCDFLHKLEVGDAIPKELYLLIAELIAFAYVLDGKFPEKWNNMHQKIMEEV
ncbi:flagellar biosynthesis protein FlhB [Shewanella sp. Choline-02u-19]|jgi:flagellar biosynthesis protein|uniref:EscU/YscU/HrcU family type III secretion system export apparatus switch protein n=1 Tax=unclassified Shewanella TaxID=196818 RepID=UPI000C31D819|nr:MULTISPECIES: EscU/YscU/HrcU family type III secretion system export apparatus switch protein [unclassified Shewanella]PKG56580.1 flagellar biosynthesis protein FlhB [Shewanella sp. GutDb-MelDb]PKH55689.1 flagellar biosynthesis protein FlhB [Shewanella sp. Bg11-22]PKI26896.1 flagellar biosynthesis protein FlhB [Shewanella sp. Choline-02u-19]